MNKTERDYYNFLVSLPEDAFDNWLEKATNEELDLADRLFDEVKFGKLDEVEDLSDAQSVLKQFTLKG